MIPLYDTRHRAENVDEKSTRQGRNQKLSQEIEIQAARAAVGGHDNDSGATACRAPASLESSLLQLLLVGVHGELFLLPPGHGVDVDEGGVGGRLPGLE